MSDLTETVARAICAQDSPVAAGDPLFDKLFDVRWAANGDEHLDRARAAIALVVEEAANEVIRRIAEAAEAVGWQAGVGGSELAGAIVSYLSAHPEHTQAFLAEGFLSLPGDIWAEGRLTFLNSRGEVTTPQTLRRARTVRRLERSAEPLAKPGGQ